MTIYSLLFLLLSNAVTSRWDKYILYSRKTNLAFYLLCDAAIFKVILLHICICFIINVNHYVCSAFFTVSYSCLYYSRYCISLLSWIANSLPVPHLFVRAPLKSKFIYNIKKYIYIISFIMHIWTFHCVSYFYVYFIKNSR